MRKIINLLVAAMAATSLHAQGIDETLSQIEQNNLELQALRQQSQADKLEVKTRNSIDDPNVEYSPFFNSGTSGMAMSELVVTLGFDFPTLYAARHTAGKYRQEALSSQYEASRREILLEAKTLCLDLIRLNQESELILQRLHCADELLELFQRRLDEGDVSILDVHKIKMKRMDIKAEQTANDAQHRETLQKLLAFNAGIPLQFSATSYPEADQLIDLDVLMDEILTTDASLQSSNANLLAARKEVSVSRQGWLPKLEVGYRRNTELDEKFNGFLIGGSLPIFTNRHKTKIAKAQALSAQLFLDDARLKTQAEVHALFNSIRQTAEALQVYDLQLMSSTLNLLYQAVTEGQLSIIDYYSEADDVYTNMTERIRLECDYHKLLAKAYKNRL